MISAGRDTDSGQEEEGKKEEERRHLIKLRDTGDDNEMVALRGEAKEEQTEKTIT